MLKQGLIAKADGRYASPLCLIWKKGKPRVVVDYRAVNKAVLPNQKGTISPIQEQLLKVKPGSVLSVFDLTKAFMNFRITEETSQRLAFITSDMVYQPLRLPFGMVLSLSKCINAMKTILHGLDQRFSTCGPRTPKGPRGASKGSVGKPRKVMFFFVIKYCLIDGYWRFQYQGKLNCKKVIFLL